ncbi:MAG: hypothetical protein HQM10_09925 [Candidatus Riflebacteria bacterium]|nr:hypothetical protein [Candidatus Riflebacteria bacterium]
MDEYKQNMEESIIAYLSEIMNLALRISMNIYYRSKLAEQIADGLSGIENLDYKHLVQNLTENEPELFLQFFPLNQRNCLISAND